jgi:flagellar biosynthesis protein FliR
MAIPLQTLEALLSAEIARLAWPFFRIAGLVMVAPVFGARLVPIRIRLALAVAVTMAVAPGLAMPPTAFDASFGGALVVVHEVLVGAAMGFTLQMIFDAVIVAGQTIAMSMGLGFAMMVDPQRGVSVPVLSQFYVIVGMLVFLALGGHLAVIRMLFDSFGALPIGATFSSDGLWALVSWGSQLFAGAMRIALPAVTALLVMNLAFGVMSRAAPTLNLFAIGFPTAILVGFVVLFLNMGSFPNVFSGLLEAAIDNVGLMLGN